MRVSLRRVVFHGRFSGWKNGVFGFLFDGSILLKLPEKVLRVWGVVGVVVNKDIYSRNPLDIRNRKVGLDIRRIPGKEGHRWTWKKGRRNRRRRGRKGKREAFFRGMGQWIILFGMIGFSGFWTRSVLPKFSKKGVGRWVGENRIKTILENITIKILIPLSR
jgi:hypothetical protein